jgi:hypothetical protein
MKVPSDQTERIAVRVSPALKKKFEDKCASMKPPVSMSDRLREFIERDVKR